MFTQTIKERDSFAGTPIVPQLLNTAGQTVGSIDASKFNRINWILGVGTIGSGNVQMYAIESDNANMANATNITNAAITNVTTANSVSTLELQAMQLTARYVSVVVVATNAVVVVLPQGTVGRFPPVNNNDVATVIQRVVTPINTTVS